MTTASSVPRMPGLTPRAPARGAHVRSVAVRRLSDGVPYVEVGFQWPGGRVRGRYWLTPGAISSTVRGLAAVGVTLDLDADDRWTYTVEPIHFDLPLVDVLCSEDETHGVPGVVRTFVAFVAHPARHSTHNTDREDAP